jgi:hypothetical protein
MIHLLGTSSRRQLEAQNVNTVSALTLKPLFLLCQPQEIGHGNALFVAKTQENLWLILNKWTSSKEFKKVILFQVK